MTEATENQTADSQGGGARQPRRVVCPQCQAYYRLPASTRGRRVRCRHCGHVWRDEADAADAVAGALGTAATTWSQLGATMLKGAGHGSSIGRMVRDTARPIQPLAADWVGRTLGKYALKAVLGQGAMGHVYEAYDQDLKRTVALKVLPRRVTADRKSVGLKMFLQEARVAAGLQHPNVVTVYEVGQEEGMYFFAMERVHGITLFKLIEQHGPLPANQACYVIAHVAAALAAGHAMGVVHRDVKPGNIMIDTSGHVKVTDFGLAHVEDVEGIPELAGRLLGTPGWISPEVARNEPATPASDIYGLGLTLYFVMTRDRLIQAESRSGMVRLQREAKSIRREQLPKDWPPRLLDIAVQCLQADPKDRYQSADVLAADLLRALVPDEADGTVVLGTGPTETGPRFVSPVLSWLALGVLCVLVAVLFAIWFWVLG
ncbi:MAG: zinc-ribbon domain-containing protein [Phycisphaerae bacterium]|nr:zinc-ribbon domain-containing protein [Phycisphaerae bacterium]